ncbi:MAG: hypothetical protein ACTSO9_21790, partial [Candidatus Helarchaeota archaeon]
WNVYLNQCSTCNKCESKKKLKLLTSKKFGSKNADPKEYEEYFSEKIINMVKWMKKELKLIYRK